NLMSHVYAARRLVPEWLERGEGYFVSTASAAGMLSQIGDVTYTVSKHGAVAFAEWLAITYGDKGLRVSCLCPMGVNTPLVQRGLEMEDERGLGAKIVAASRELLDPADAATDVRAEVKLLRSEAERGTPILGVCLGGQLLAHALGGTVEKLAVRMVEWAEVEKLPEAEGDPVFGGLPERIRALHWNEDGFSIPPGGV